MRLPLFSVHEDVTTRVSGEQMRIDKIALLAMERLQWIEQSVDHVNGVLVGHSTA